MSENHVYNTDQDFVNHMNMVGLVGAIQSAEIIDGEKCIKISEELCDGLIETIEEIQDALWLKN